MPMKCLTRPSLLLLLSIALFGASATTAQWSAQPGETVRNSFGPQRIDGKPFKTCRGACGSGCPDSCEESVTYECMDSTRLLKVRVYDCGTNLGCREHDDCLDACTSNPSNDDCDMLCHQAAAETYGMERSMSWLGGGGPYDGQVVFEYTREQPGSPEGIYRCPSGSRLECGGASGKCVGAGGVAVEPVFDSYSGTSGMRVANLQSGRLCGNSVCKPAKIIPVSGQDTCEGASCTRFGMEFDYTGADPSEPLKCRTPIVDEGEKSFVEKMFRPMVESGNAGDVTGGGEGMNELLGAFSQIIKAVESGEAVSVAPLGEDGKPIESERVHLEAEGAQGSSIPNSIDLPAASGHLVVPMHQLADSGQTEPVTREIYCTHKGEPVLETSFVLQF